MLAALPSQAASRRWAAELQLPPRAIASSGRWAIYGESSGPTHWGGPGPIWALSPAPSAAAKTALPLSIGARGSVTLPLHVAAERLAGLDSSGTALSRGGGSSGWCYSGGRCCCGRGWWCLLISELVAALVLEPHFLQPGAVS